MMAVVAGLVVLCAGAVAPQYTASQCSSDLQERVFRKIQDTGCRPRPQSVEIDLTNHTAAVQVIPSHVIVSRCGGACYSPAYSCHPEKQTLVPVDVIVISSKFAEGEMTTQCSTVYVQEDQECSCSCKVRASHCNQLQVYQHSTCQCVCQNYQERNLCVAQGKNWDPTSCSCRCPASSWRVCNTGSVFDTQKTCECVPTVLLASPPLVLVLILILLSSLGVLFLCLYSRRMQEEGLKRRGSLARVLEEGDDDVIDSGRK